MRAQKPERPRADVFSANQFISSKREISQKRVSLLHLSSEQNLTLQRRNSSSSRIALHTEQPVSVRKSVTRKRVALLNVITEHSITVVASGTRRLREELEALVRRVEELEKSQP